MGAKDEANVGLPVQVAGGKCEVCGRTVVFAVDGKFCAQCGTIVHLACEPQIKCPQCGKIFQGYTRPAVDPASEAFVPPVLRGDTSNGLTVGALIVAVAGIIVIILAYSFFSMLGNGD